MLCFFAKVGFGFGFLLEVGVEVFSSRLFVVEL